MHQITRRRERCGRERRRTLCVWGNLLTFLIAANTPLLTLLPSLTVPISSSNPRHHDRHGTDKEKRERTWSPSSQTLSNLPFSHKHFLSHFPIYLILHLARLIKSWADWVLNMAFERGREGELSDSSFCFSSFSRGCSLWFGR